jgi:hypothetical protein
VAVATPEPGTGIPAARIGHYRVLRRLGAGGMGMVYLGYDDVAGVLAAVKVIRPEYAGDPLFRARLRQEVAAARRVPRFCTAPLLAGDLDADPPWVATEFIDAPTLDAAVLERGPLTGPALETLAAGVAVALREIHHQGVVHRDLKPSNILLPPPGPRVIDFGIARLDDSLTHLTHPGGVIGTPAYMAPEQLRGEQVTTAIDVFAWAGVVSYAANGRPPFGTGDGVMHAILYDGPDLGSLDGPLRDLVVAAFHKIPTARPSAAELVDRLSRAAPGATAQVLAGAAASPAAPPPPPALPPATYPAMSPVPAPPVPSVLPPAVQPAGWTGTLVPARPGPPWPWLALGAVVLVLLVTVAVVTAILFADRDTSGGSPPGGPDVAADATDQCLVGTWTMVASSRTWTIAGDTVVMSSTSPSVLTVQPDGSAELDYRDGQRETGATGVGRYEILLTGTLTVEARTSGDTILRSNHQAHAEQVTLLNGFEIAREPVQPDTAPLRYACDDDSLALYDSAGTTEWVRSS